MNTRIYYLAYYGSKEPVIESQVLVPLRKLKERGIETHLIFLENIGDWFRRPFVSLPRIPRNFLFLNTFLVGLLLLKPLLNGEGVIIHARGLQGATCVLPLKKLFKNIRVICDIRGLEAAEYEYRIRETRETLSSFQQCWQSHLEKGTRSVVQKADALFCVSREMKTYFLNQNPSADASKWEYIPCSVDVGSFSKSLALRGEKRKQLKIDARLVFLYAGSMNAWQLPEKTVQLFRFIQSLQPNAYFLGLTNDGKVLSDLLLKSGVRPQDFMVQFVPHHDIANYMVCGDVGFLLRDKHILNFYSCPTKFGEYLASGLHIFTTPAIADVVEMINSEKTGTILSQIKEFNAIKEELRKGLEAAALTEKRIAISVRAAHQYFDWEAQVPKIKKWYLKLSENLASPPTL